MKNIFQPKNQSMKNEKITLDNVQSYIDTATNALMEKGRSLGSDFGLENLPRPIGDSLASYTVEISTGIKEIWYRICTELDSERVTKLAEIDRENQDVLHKALEDNFREAKVNRDRINEKLIAYEELQSTSSLWWVGIALFFIILVESIFNTSFFQSVMSDLVLWQIHIIAFFAYVVIFGCTLLAQHIIRKTYSEVKKNLIYGFIIILFSIIFAYVSFARVIYSNEGVFSWILFLGNFCFNIVFFCCMLYLDTFIPDRDTWNRMKERDVLEAKKNECEHKLEIIKKELKQGSSLNGKLIRDTHDQLIQISRYKKQLVIKYEKIMSAFISANSAIRPDKLVPDCIKHIEPIDLN